MKKQLILVCAALLLQGVAFAEGPTYDEWCARDSDQRNEYMAPLSLQQRREFFYKSLGGIGKELNMFIDGARQAGFQQASVPENFNSRIPGLYPTDRLPEDAGKYDHKLSDFMASYAQFVLQPRGKHIKMFRGNMMTFLDKTETKDLDEAFVYPVALVLYYRLSLYKVYGVQPWFPRGVLPWFQVFY